MINFKYSNPLKEDYGYSIDNPIEVTSTSDEYFYLDNLITDTRLDIHYEREGSCDGKTPYPIDIFNIYVGNKKICDLYIYGYSDKYSIIAPRGFFYVEQINWGEGIPKYDETDLLTCFEIQDFAVQVIIHNSINEYEILGFNNRLNIYPNIFMKKEDKIYAVLVRGGNVKKQPTITQKEIELMNEISFKLNVIPLFASVGFGAVDGERFNKDIFLRGDGYYINFTGFEEIEIKEDIVRKINEDTILDYVWVNFLNIISQNRKFIDLYLVLEESRLIKENGNTYLIEFVDLIYENEKNIIEMPQNKEIISNFLSRLFNKNIVVVLKYPKK